MKTKLNILVVLVLLAALFGGSVSAAQAGKAVACTATGSPGIVMLATSGSTFKFCGTIDGSIYTVRMIRTYELTYSARMGDYVMARGTGTSFKSLAWVYSDPVWANLSELTFEMTTSEGTWQQLVFTMHLFADSALDPASVVHWDIKLLGYQWQSPDPEAKLAVEYEMKKNGTSLGTQTVIFDHFEGDLYHD